MIFELQGKLLELFLRVPNESFATAAQVVEDRLLQETSNQMILEHLHTLTLTKMLFQSKPSVYSALHYTISIEGAELCSSLGIIAPPLDASQQSRLNELRKQEQRRINIQEYIVALLKSIQPCSIPMIVIHDYLLLKANIACDWATTVGLLSQLATSDIIVNSCNGLLWSFNPFQNTKLRE